MYYKRNSGAAALIASLLAGPIFVLAFLLTLFVRQIPEPILLPGMKATELGIALIIVVTVVVVGFVLSFVPNLFGAAFMAELSVRYEWAQSALTWTAAGAVVGTLIAWIFVRNSYYGEPDLLVLFPLIATAAACAGLCWRGMGWTRLKTDQG